MIGLFFSMPLSLFNDLSNNIGWHEKYPLMASYSLDQNQIYRIRGIE